MLFQSEYTTELIGDFSPVAFEVDASHYGSSGFTLKPISSQRSNGSTAPC